MLQTDNSVEVNATAEEAWELLSDFEGVWENSNPAHQGTKVLSRPKRPIRDGLQWWQRENVGILTGEFVATVHDTFPGRRFSWTTTATYKLLGFPLKVDEGGTVEILDRTGGIILRHALWGKLPSPVLEWIARYLLREEHAMQEHNLTELRYFKKCLECTEKLD